MAQLFISIGESLPQQRWQPVAEVQKRGRDKEEMDLFSLLDSCHLSIDEICVTVSTPLCTALRFHTSRIDMLITNSGRQAVLAGWQPSPHLQTCACTFPHLQMWHLLRASSCYQVVWTSTSTLPLAICRFPALALSLPPSLLSVVPGFFQ